MGDDTCKLCLSDQSGVQSARLVIHGKVCGALHGDSSAPPDYSNARSAFFWRCGSNLTVKRLRQLPQRIWGVAAQRGFIHLRLVNEPGSPLPAVDHAGTRLWASSGFKEKPRQTKSTPLVRSNHSGWLSKRDDALVMPAFPACNQSAAPLF